MPFLGGFISVPLEDQNIFNRVGVQSKHKGLALFYSLQKDVWFLESQCFFVVVFVGGGRDSYDWKHVKEAIFMWKESMGATSVIEV